MTLERPPITILAVFFQQIRNPNRSWLSVEFSLQNHTWFSSEIMVNGAARRVLWHRFVLIRLLGREMPMRKSEQKSFMAASNSKGRHTVQLRKHLDDNTQRTGRTIHRNACFNSRLSIFPRHAALSVPLLVLRETLADFLVLTVPR